MARKGLPGSLIKKHGGNMKKAWAEYRRRGSAPRSAKKSASPRKRKAATTATKTKTKRRTRTAVAKVKGKRMARRGKRVAKAVLASQPIKLVGGVAVATGGAVGTSLAVNNLPGVKNLPPLGKSGLQFALGLVAMMTKYGLLKQAGVGAIMASGMGVARHLFKVEPLAGDASKRMSDEDMLRMVGRLGRPVNYSGTLGRPVDYAGAGGMGRPASVDLQTGWGGGFGSGF